ncbi:MAG: GSU2403 family nucleotidyltransferase fold protein [Pseudomonadota bacterium]|nr:GSU2403 family nucleotidyltransferase fold protein [Pseudomonadota bacterium]
MRELPQSTQLLYTQLLSQCLQASSPASRGLSFVSKLIKGGRHWYLQLTIGSRKTQHYVGPDTPEVHTLIENEKQLWKEAEPDRAAREQLVSMLISGGALTVSAAEARLLEVLERAGVFLLGGVLVGSHAFSIYGNMLGVEWPIRTLETHDIDIAGDERVTVGFEDQKTNLRQALLDSGMGVVEVPALNRKSPSTVFRIQGKQLSVDLLTPLVGKPTGKPVLIPALKTYAEPVRFLDYLMESAQPAVVVARAGIIVNVPAPARFALHKLVTAARRPAAQQTKVRKDLKQAELLLEVLFRDRPGDISQAIKAARQMPDKFFAQLASGAERLPDKSLKQLLEGGAGY